MKQFARVTAMSVLLTALSSGYAQAATFTETRDAGETLDTAQVIKGSQPLESVSGALVGGADLFKIFLTGSQTFSATTISPETLELPVDKLLGVPTELLEDPQLFLFDSRGRGVYANDDSFGTIQSTLPSGPGGFSPAAAGTYFLGISGFNYNPVSAGGEIFPDQSDEISGPTGPGGGLSLSGFTGSASTSGRYTIALTGARAVPEPSSVVGTLAFSALSVVWMLKRKRKNIEASPDRILSNGADRNS